MSLAYFPLYADRYEADTTHLSLLEDGAYNRLLRLCWRSPGCKLPNDMQWIFRQLRAQSNEDQAAVIAVLAEYFTKGRGKIWSGKLLKVFVQVSVAHQNKSEAGKKGAAAKALKTNKSDASTATAQLKQPEPEPKEERKKEERGKPLSSASADFENFWIICPRKISKEKARQAYVKALRKADPKTIDDGMSRYAATRAGQDAQFTAHPVTWLNNERWTDQPDPQTGNSNAKPSRGDKFLHSFLAGSVSPPALDFGQDCHPARPLLARG